MHDAANAMAANNLRQSMACPPTRGTRGIIGTLISPPLAPSLPPRLIEVSQVRRLLVLLGWHQVAIRAQHVVFLSNADMRICLHTTGLDPDWIAVPTIILDHRPRTGQRTVDGSNFVMQNLGIGFVEINPLLHDSLIVAMQRNA